MRRSALLCVAALAACTQPVQRVEEQSTAPLPEASYAVAARAGAAVFRILPKESLVLVRVGRSGPMQRLGHEHAVASEDVQGLVQLSDDPAASRADIVMPLRNLLVDQPEHRAKLGLDDGPSAEDIAGTYSNMLKVLEPALYPWAMVHARIADEASGASVLGISVTLHATSHEYLVPVEFSVTEDRLAVRGQLTLRHSDFNLTPFAAAGGLLRVADALDIRFELAGRLQAGPVQP